MSLRARVVTLVGLLALSFGVVQAQDWSIVIGPGGGFDHHPGHGLGQKKQMVREISRKSSYLFSYARQMAYIHDIRERIALDNFARFDREALMLANSQGGINKLEIRRLEQAYQISKSTIRDLRAFDYYREEFRDLDREVQRLFTFADPTPIPPAPGPFPFPGPSPFPYPVPGPFPHPGPGYGTTQIISCASYSDNYTECLAAGQIFTARVRNQQSNSACRQGIDWGFHYNTLWVDNGCRANFEIVIR
jgi:hypothetical protein